MANISDAEKILLETLGLRFLAFTFNIDESEVAARLEDGASLPPQREAILDELVAFLGAHHTRQSADSFDLYLALGALGEFQSSAGMGWATAQRMQVGGAIDLPRAEGNLDSALLLLVRDIYPLFLLPESSDPHRLSYRWIIPSLRNRAKKEFNEAVLADPVLAQLFPYEDKHSGRHGVVHRSTGRGGGIQLVLFAEMILRSGWHAAQRKQPHPSPADLAAGSRRMINIIKAAIDGVDVTIPARVGISGLRINEGSQVKLPWGRLREVNEADRSLVPPGLSGRVTTTTATGEDVVIDYAGDLVMELEVPYEIEIGRDEIDDRWPVPNTSSEIVERRLETLQLALLLSSERGTWPLAVGTWRHFLDPLDSGFNIAWHDPRDVPGLRSNQSSVPSDIRHKILGLRAEM